MTRILVFTMLRFFFFSLDTCIYDKKKGKKIREKKVNSPPFFITRGEIGPPSRDSPSSLSSLSPLAPEMISPPPSLYIDARTKTNNF